MFKYCFDFFKEIEMKLELFFVRNSVANSSQLWNLVIGQGIQIPDDSEINKAAKEHFGENAGIYRKLDASRIVITVPEKFGKIAEDNFLSALTTD